MSGSGSGPTTADGPSLLSEYADMFGWGNMLRSAEMEYVTIVMQEHLAADVVQRLGGLGAVQFTDLNGDLTAFKRFYTPAIRRCDELEKKLRLFEEELGRYGVATEDVSPGALATWRQSQLDAVARDHPGLSLLDFWEAVIAERHRDYLALKAERERTAAALYHAAQRRFVIERAAGFFLEEAAAAAAAGGAAGGAGAGAGGRAAARAAAAAAPGDAEAGTAAAAAAAASASAADAEAVAFKHLAGIIDTAEKVRFARIVFRASTGHAVVRFADVPGDVCDDKGRPHAKSVFAVFYRGASLAPKLERICAAFGAAPHDVPSFASPADVAGALDEAKAAITAALKWLDAERATTAASLAHVGLLVKKWRAGVQREKAVLHALNCFTRDFERGSVTAQGWVLASAVESVKDAVRAVHAGAAAGGRVQPFYIEVARAGAGLPKPPTHFATNKFTAAFQNFVNTYGVPRYREANPALFAIVTFPFIFGVMFGDIGHSTLLFLAALWIVLNEDALGAAPLSEMFVMVFYGRYMILLMAAFGVFCGGVYNDMFSLGTAAFKSAWTLPAGAKTAVWANDAGAVYPFGIDPEWHGADNGLLFFNSLKMKLSVILGVVQMSFGLVLKAANAVHFGAWADLWLEAVPQIVFTLALLWYMIFIIVLKWSIDWGDPAARPGAPPSLIDTLINIALKPGVVADKLYASQTTVQSLILLVVFATVPVMLLGKPYALSRPPAGGAAGGHGAAAHGAGAEHEKANLLTSDAAAAGAGTGLVGVAVVSPGVEMTVAAGGHGHGGGGGHHGHHGHGHAHGGAPSAAAAAAAADAPPARELVPRPPAGDAHEAHHSFNDLFVHQGIETIEFVLGSISNTASYLRLWALSLAHSQLATVFWERAFLSGVATNDTVSIVIGFGAFAVMSGVVLLLMDVLECFLHSLRLHWVEFQNKFYKADGYKFTPFSFAAVAEAARAEEMSKAA